MEKKLYHVGFLEKLSDDTSWRYDTVFVSALSFENAHGQFKEEKPQAIIESIREEKTKLL